MSVKNTIGSGLFLAFGILIIIAGTYTFFRLKADKENSNINLYSLIPKNADLILQIHDPIKLNEDRKSVTAFSSLLPDNRIYHLTGYFPNKLIISFHDSSSVIYAKLDNDDFTYLRNRLLKNVFPYSLIKNIKSNGIRVEVLPGPNGDFFSFCYHKGVFIGSYNNNELNNAIRLFRDENSLARDSSFKEALQTVDHNALINVIIHEKNYKKLENSIPFSQWMGCDIEINDGELNAFGTILHEQPDHIFGQLLQENSDSMGFTPTDIPYWIDRCIQIRTDSTPINNLVTDSLLARSLRNNIGVYTLHQTDSSEIISLTVDDLQFDDFFHHRRKLFTYISDGYYGYNYPEMMESKNAFGLEKLFENQTPSDSVFYFSKYNDCFLISKDETWISQHISQLESIDTLWTSPSYLQIPPIVNGTKILIMDRSGNYRSFVQLFRNKGALYFYITARKIEN